MFGNRHPFAVPIALALASYATSVTSLTLACAIWLPLFTIEPGTEVRPMGQTMISFMFASMGTIVAIGLAFGCVATGYQRVLPWVLGVVCLALALQPLPLSWQFFHWVMETQGLIAKP